MYWKNSLVSVFGKTGKVIVFLALALPLLFTSVPVVHAKNLKFMEVINIPPDPALSSAYDSIRPQARDPDWGGPLTGDITAVAYFWERLDKNYNTGSGGKIEHFFEDFLIIFNDGGWVKGWNNGIFHMTNKPNLWRYSAEGRVTATSSDKQSFLGSKFFEAGYVTFPSPDHIVGVARGYLGS